MEPIVQFFKKQFDSQLLSSCWIIKVKNEEYLEEIKLISKYVLYSSETHPHGLPNSYVDKQIDKNSYPNFLYIPKSSFDDGSVATEIKLDQAKLLTDFIKKKPAIDSWRVIVVDKIDDMNRFAANSILKSVEEPPSRTLMLFIAKQFGLVLPTIRSRCKVVEFFEGTLKKTIVYESAYLTRVNQTMVDSLLSKNVYQVMQNIKDFSITQSEFNKCVKHILYILYKKSLGYDDYIKKVNYASNHWLKAYEAVNMTFSNTVHAHLNLNQLLIMVFATIKNPSVILTSSIYDL